MQHGLGLPTLGLGQLENDTVIRKSRQSGSVKTPGRIKRQAGPGEPPSEPVNSCTTVPFQRLPERLTLNTPPSTSRVCSSSTGGTVQVSARVQGQGAKGEHQVALRATKAIKNSFNPLASGGGQLKNRASAVVPAEFRCSIPISRGVEN
jgi:hypothetical protein